MMSIAPSCSMSASQVHSSGSRAAGALDHRGRLVHLAPIAPLRRLVMRELDPHAAAATDLEVLLDRREEVVTLVADVARVEAIAFAHDRGEGADLVGRAVRARRVD